MKLNMSLSKKRLINTINKRFDNLSEINWNPFKNKESGENFETANTILRALNSGVVTHVARVGQSLSSHSDGTTFSFNINSTPILVHYADEMGIYIYVNAKFLKIPLTSVGTQILVDIYKKCEELSISSVENNNNINS